MLMEIIDRKRKLTMQKRDKCRDQHKTGGLTWIGIGMVHS